MNAQPNRDDFDLRVGERLAEIRNSRDISQGELATLIGVAVGTIQNYEHGRTPLTVVRLHELAHALKCEVADLLKPSGSPLPRYRGASLLRRSRGCTMELMGLLLAASDKLPYWLSVVTM